MRPLLSASNPPLHVSAGLARLSPRRGCRALAAATWLFLIAPLEVEARASLRHGRFSETTLADEPDLGEYNKLLEAAIGKRDDKELECASQEKAAQAQQQTMEARLARTERSLQAMAAAEVHMTASFGSLSAAVSALETQRDELGRVCRQLDESRDAQKALLDPVESNAAKVEKTIVKLVGPFSAKLAQIRGSHADQKAMLAESSEACRRQLALIDHEQHTTKQTAADAEKQLKALEKDKSTLESTRVALAASIAASQKQQAAGKLECDQHAAGMVKSIADLRSKRAAGLKGILVTDCEVTPWRAEGSCSAKCKGGTRQLKREVLRYPGGGALCPKLSAKAPCNLQPCPVACQLSTWSPWTTCSAQCNGGFRSRNRTVVAPSGNVALALPLGGGGGPVPSSASAEVAMFDGADKLACGLGQEVESCNTQACGDGCIYGAWGAWGSCTKACGGGRRGRKRTLKPASEAPGSATVCQGWVTEFSACKEQKCPAEQDRKCAAKTDFVFLVDTSELLKTPEKDLQRAFVKQTLNGLTMDRAAGAVAGIVFYGAWAPKGVMKLPLTDSKEAIEERLDKMPTGRGGVRLSSALDTAWSMMNGWSSRLGTSRIVVILLKGKPDSVMKSINTAKTLKDNGVRVIAAVVGSCIVNQHMLEKIPSEPIAENLFFFKTFEEMRSKAGDQFVSICPHLEGDGSDDVPAQYLPIPMEAIDMRSFAAHR